MKTSEEIYNILKEKFGDAIIEHQTEIPVEPIITADPLKIKEIGLFLRDNDELGFDNLALLSGVDDNNGKKVTDDEGNEHEEGRTLSVYYHLESMSIGHKILIKVSVPIDNPEVQSVELVWRVADWHEREAFDMYGIKFLGHHNLIRILMPYDWEGFPLRKDYKNPEFYQGMKIPYN